MLSDELLLARAGNFTASENHRLMAGWDEEAPRPDFSEFPELYKLIKPLYIQGKRKFLVGDFKKENLNLVVNSDKIKQTVAFVKGEQPPTGLVSYAHEKAIESLFDHDPSLTFSTAHTRNGEERELECMDRLAKATGINFVNTGDNQTHIHANEVGCTPDGIVLDELDLVMTGAEAKCKSANVHAKNLLINNNKDMQRLAFDHYVQVQTAMSVTGADHWYFANFNPFAKQKEMVFKHVIINRDEKFIDALNKRINWAKKIKAEYISVLNQINEAA